MAALTIVHSPKFHQNMVNDSHPALIADSDFLHENITFSANFLHKCEFNLDYIHNIIFWIEYKLPLHNIHQFCSQEFEEHLIEPFGIVSETGYLVNQYIQAHATFILDEG